MPEAVRCVAEERGGEGRPTIAATDDYAVTVVEDDDGLIEVAEALDRADRIALDTESNSLHVYRENVCFIQIRVGPQVFLIDTLAVTDLEPLRAALTDPDKLKLLHGADYDIVCIKRDFNIGLFPIFDTMISAQMLGYEQLGLAALVERHFGATLDKTLTRHDWGARPLEQRYVPYLVDDVVYLEELHDILDAALEQRDFQEEAEIEFDRVSEQEWSGSQEVDPERFRKIKGSRDLDRAGLSILREMYLLRDRVAKDANVPPFRVLGNEQLLNVAHRRPRNLRDLKAIRGFTDRVLRKMGTRVIDSVRFGIDNAENISPRPPRRERPPETQVAIDEGLRQWRRGVCQKTDLPSVIVLPNHVIERIAIERPADLKSLAGIETLGDKRLKRYGTAILKVVADPPPVRRGRR